MTMPIGNMPAGPALAKTAAGAQGLKDPSPDDNSFGDLLRVPARSKGAPQKSGPSAEPTRLRVLQPAAGLEDADDKSTAAADDMIAEPGDAQGADEAAARKDRIALPATKDDPASADAKPMQPAMAASDAPKQDAGGGTVRAEQVPTMPRWGDWATGEHRNANASAAQQSPAAVEMPGAKSALARPEFIHLDNPTRQSGDVVSDLKNALRVGADAPAATPASDGGDRFETIRPGRVAEWKGERVNIIAQQNIPAPVAQPAASTASSLVAMLSGDAGWREAAATSFQPLAARPPLSSAHSLKLQLHPAELGMVTASLRLSGEHLTVDLQVENQDAYQRLSTDSEIIVKSMRALGLDIDKVTVQQPQSGAQTQMRADGTASSSSFNARGQDLSGQAGSGGGAGNGDQQSGRSGNETSRGTGNGASAVPDRSGGDIYI
jgi:chemotaxis protein MotD